MESPSRVGALGTPPFLTKGSPPRASPPVDHCYVTPKHVPRPDFAPGQRPGLTYWLRDFEEQLIVALLVANPDTNLAMAFVATPTQRRQRKTTFRLPEGAPPLEPRSGLRQQALAEPFSPLRGRSLFGAAEVDSRGQEEYYVYLENAVRPHEGSEVTTEVSTVRVPMKDGGFKRVNTASLDFWEHWSDEIKEAVEVVLCAKGGLEKFTLQIDEFEIESGSFRFSLLREYVTAAFDDIYRSKAGGLSYWNVKEALHEAIPDMVYNF